MDFTKEQLSELISKHTEKENGLQDLMEIMLESMMVSERREYLREEGLSGNKCNGYRPGRTYGHGRTLTFRIPRDRYGNFHPRILAILKDQEEECERLAGTLYTKGLTQEQVGEVFNDIYGEHYSKASISRMLDYLRNDVAEWLERSLCSSTACTSRSTAGAASIRRRSMLSWRCGRTRPGRCSASSTSLRRVPWAGARCSATCMIEESAG